MSFAFDKKLENKLIKSNLLLRNICVLFKTNVNSILSCVDHVFPL